MTQVRRVLIAVVLLATALLGVPASWAQPETAASRVAHAAGHAQAGRAAAGSSEAAHWSRVPGFVPPRHGIRQSVSCVTLSHCTAVDDAGNASVFNGRSWRDLRSADHHLGPLTSVSCPTTSFCAAVGGVREVVMKKGTWGAVHVAPANLTSVSCWAASRCRAVGDGGTTMRYDGSWHRGPDAATADLAVVSCTSRSFCMAVDGSGHSYKLHDGRWVAKASALPDINCPSAGAGCTDEHVSLDCATTHLCMAATGLNWVSRWDGTTWKERQLQPNSLFYSAAVSCSGPDYCAWVTNGGEFAAWRHGWGSVSHHRHIAGGDAYPPPFDCPGRARCLLIGGLQTTTVRHGFHRTATPPVPVVQPSVDCPTAGTCVGIPNGSKVWSPVPTPREFKPRLFHHGKWTPQAITSGRVPRGQVSCGSATVCMAVSGWNDLAYVWRGQAWSRGRLLPEATYWTVSCATAEYCLVGGYDDEQSEDVPTLVWDGHSWSGASFDPTPDVVQCPAASDCWAINQGQPWHWDGTIWTNRPPVLETDAKMSCPTTTFCVAVDQYGNLAYDQDGTWSTGELVAPMTALSCASATSCIGMLADRPGFDATYDGQSWTIARALPKGYGGTVTDISCVGQGTCMVVDSAGNSFRRTA